MIVLRSRDPSRRQWQGGGGGINYTGSGKQKAGRFVDLRIENNPIYQVHGNDIFGGSD